MDSDDVVRNVLGYGQIDLMITVLLFVPVVQLFDERSHALDRVDRAQLDFDLAILVSRHGPIVVSRLHSEVDEVLNQLLAGRS